jgi:hypothetical protein
MVNMPVFQIMLLLPQPMSKSQVIRNEDLRTCKDLSGGAKNSFMFV